MGNLLDSLGLKSPLEGGLPPVQTQDGRTIDLNLSKDYLLRKEQAQKPKVDFKLPSDPKAQVDVFAQALEKTTDAVQRDKLVRGLRDALAKIPVPFMTADEVKKAIDDGIKSLIESKSKELLLKLIETAVGQKAQKVDPDAKPQYGPRVEEKDLGEKILKSPEFPLPWDKPKQPVQGFFEFRGLPRTAKPNTYVSFKLRTPHWWDSSRYPGTYVVVRSAEDHAKGSKGRNEPDVHVTSPGEVSLSVAMPDAPGAYVVVVSVQGQAEHDPVERIEVKP